MNALSELAIEIGCLGKLNYSAGVIQTDELTPRDYAVIDKAQRIIAELAKVKINSIGGPYDEAEAYAAISKCREIAEEGAKQ